MPLDPKKIEVGKCYATSMGQVRRVLDIKDGKVIYEARGKKAVTGPWPNQSPPTPPNLETFAQAVEREVAEDWDPDYSN